MLRKPGRPQAAPVSLVDERNESYYLMRVRRARGAFLISEPPDNPLAMNALVSYLKHVRAEFQHVTWPTRRVAVSHTLIVILITIVTAALAAVLDSAFTGALRAFFG